MNEHAPFRLTGLAHGGGCGCKLAPAVLQSLLAGAPQGTFPGLLVGAETSDDAAVFDIGDGQCVISTTDFFMPVVDDPHDFGAIAATNALSDIYAMGGRPIMALAILGMPVDKMPVDVVRGILEGGRAACAAAGVPVAGGHSIDAPEPIYGLAVTGLCRRSELRRNCDARPGDALILTKALGVGLYSAAFKKGRLGAAAYDEMLASTILLNRIGGELGRDADVHAVTDVTGFGILGHGLEMARGSGATLVLDADALPWLREAGALAQNGFVTGASRRNWASYGAEIDLPAGLPDWRRDMLADPQTSGGLLIACAAGRAAALCAGIAAAGYPKTAIVGRVEAGPGRVRVEG